MAGILKVDTLQSDSNLALKIATANVAFIDSNGLNVVGGNLTIGATQFAEGGQVQTAGIADGAVTNDKIDSVANTKITGLVNNDQIASVANTKITGLITTSQLANNLTVNASSIISSANIDFKVGASQNTAFRIEDTGQLYNSIESTTGTDYRGTLYAGYMCRAWVNFNGTGTVAISASGNVSSITDNGAGDYTVNFTTAMPDANYAACAIGWTSSYDRLMCSPPAGTSWSTTAWRIFCSAWTGSSFNGGQDGNIVSASFFR